ncbi:MAG TPA: hypothetical protein VEN81_06750 [Planctomycetota bacterium]|nr:hypothetical protein [Planctomycetota bacterium]
MKRLAAMLAAGVLSACTDRPPTAMAPAKEGTPMTPNATVTRPGAPPIDREVPATLETATFALG